MVATVTFFVVVGESVAVGILEPAVEEALDLGVVDGSVVDIYIVDSSFEMAIAITVATDYDVGELVGFSAFELLRVYLFTVFVKSDDPLVYCYCEMLPLLPYRCETLGVS